MKSFRDWVSIFFEREDKEIAGRASTISEDILNSLEVYYRDLFIIYFPLPKQTDNHEKFMDWRSSCRRYENNNPKYLNRIISIISSNSNLNGEYLTDRIYLYDKKFGKLNQELKNLHHSFEYNLRGSPTDKERRKNQVIKKEAKLIYESMMERFRSQKQVYLSVLFHEVIHLLDHDKLGDRFDKSYQNTSGKLNKDVRKYNKLYINNDMETNAWFLTNANNALVKRLPNFADVLEDFKSGFGSFWSLLSQDRQKKMIARLYQMYNS
jgi:hypothetical protein